VVEALTIFAARSRHLAIWGNHHAPAAGFALHQDFDLLAEAGLSPLRILQMATCDAAALVGREATLGSVEEGKNADLVLLDGDPTASAENLHAICGVVRAGTYYAREDLTAMKEGVAAAVAA
jgi:imidazolonepropionase-like amidohydrolase